MKRLCALLLLACLLILAGCGREEKVEIVSYDYFDTVTTLKVLKSDEADARRILEETLSRLDAVFDRYEPHEGIMGVYALNDAAGAWFTPEAELWELLLLCRDWYALSHAADVTQGALFALWHDFREGGSLPDDEALGAAAALGGWDKVELDEEARRVRLSPGAELDLGAVAKGYACGIAARRLEQAGISRYILSGGGNVVTGKKDSPYRVGVTDPQTGGVACVLRLENLCAVTSGGYQRYREENGVRYHHLIDPETFYPGEHGIAQVTVIAQDSALADFLSTALFLTDYEQGRALAEALGVDAIWVFPDGSMQCTPGAEAHLKQED